ncbi:MAG: hypothetical protein IT462_08135 [Planctomycetes bacterium]|nr:hypothetical protein [Planctomycetota bacterium]
MGTFHKDTHALHGITVVIDTPGKTVYVGRFHEQDDKRILLLDVDIHEDGANGRSKEEFVKRAAKFGVFKKHDHFEVPLSQVAGIRRLGDVTP